LAVQECTTDSEELMYHQVRASSSCSAPPDLLLVSERDNNIQLRSPVVNIITTPPGNASTAAATAKQQQQQQPLPLHQQQHHQQHVTRQQQEISSSGSHSKHLRISSSSGKHGKYANMPQSHHQHHQQQLPLEEDVVDAAAAMAMPATHATTHPQHSRHLHHHSKEERIRLEEFTCDVSVEGGKSSQPLQFSFTFYDLDGHHGKITKDDIVGIVYTIYESIGKSVVVPHCGSKTINVRLTVSPEGKSKSQAVATAAAAASQSQSNSSKLKKLPTGMAGMSKTVNGLALTTSGGARRQHRHRPRKLIKSDDEDDDSNSDKEKELAAVVPGVDQPATASASGKPAKSRYQKNNAKVEQCCSGQQQLLQLEQHTPDNAHNTYENMLNLKCCKEATDTLDCPHPHPHSHSHSHPHAQRSRHQHHSQDVYMKQATQRVKMLRRARKQKYQDHCLETRQRSLSVGNDSSWQNRHLQLQLHQQQQQQQPSTQQQPMAQQKSSSVSPPLGEVLLDGVQLRQPRPQSLQAPAQAQQQRKSAECWKSALNRNDLISIIRESMEKNRLCFQLNGKPQANVSPIRQPAAQQQQQPPQQQQQQQHQQRQRCNTGSKIPTLIANHSPQSGPQSPLSCSPPTQSPTQHIEAAPEPLYHAHPHPHPQPHIPIYHQQLAINPAVVAAQHSHNSAHNKLNLCGYDSFLHATICGGGAAAAHSPPATPSNVATVQPIPKKSSSHNKQQQLQQPQQGQQGYQRLEQQPQRSSKDYKNYGNLIYAKLSEQLQQKEREQRRQRHKQQQQQKLLAQTAVQREEPRPATSSSSSAGSKIYGDALECAHLLASEEEELAAPSPLHTSTPSKVVSTNTLIDLNDDVGEAVAEAVTTAKDLDDPASASASAADGDLDTSASSSMIHRYVHEHIHHHYHHFKEQNDV
ncbi:hypothetical protein KR093_003407, partial [Drosophila rubida]